MGLKLTDWRRCELGDALTLQRGFDLPHRLRREGRIPIVSSSGISGTHDSAQVSAPGIVTGRYGTIGEVFYITEDFWPLNTTLYVRDYRGNDPLYLSYLMRTVDFATHSGKSGVPGVNRNDIHKLTIALPPPAEQRAIAEALSDVDGLLGALEALIAKKRAIKQAAMQQLLTGKTRLPGFSMAWEGVSLGDLFDFKNGLNKAKEFFGHGTPIVNYMDVFVENRLTSSKLTGRVQLSRQEIQNFDVRQGDVFFTRTSETTDEIGIAAVMLDEPTDTVFSGFVLRARPKNQRMCDEFKAYCFSCQSVRSQIISTASYTTRALTNGKLLSRVSLILPPREEQMAIAIFLSDMDAEIALIERRRDKTRAIKQGMMQQLLTGRIRLVEPKAKEAP